MMVIRQILKIPGLKSELTHQTANNWKSEDLQTPHNALILDPFVRLEFVEDPWKRFDSGQQVTRDRVVRSFKFVRCHLSQSLHSTVRDAVHVDLLWENRNDPSVEKSFTNESNGLASCVI